MRQVLSNKTDKNKTCLRKPLATMLTRSSKESIYTENVEEARNRDR